MAIDVPVSLAFPDAFKNPGSTAPVLDLVVRNTGGVTLHVASLEVLGDPSFDVIDGEPADIAPMSEHAYHVRFAPTHVGDVTSSRLVVTSDDPARPMAEVSLTGAGLARDVMFAPKMIEFGFVGIGGFGSVGNAIEVTNLDRTHAFTIAQIGAGDPQFGVVGAIGTPLAPNETRAFTVVFIPLESGMIDAPARLFLDEDPDAHAFVTLRGTAIDADVHGGGGCSSSGPSGALVAIALLGVRRRRR